MKINWPAFGFRCLLAGRRRNRGSARESAGGSDHRRERGRTFGLDLGGGNRPVGRADDRAHQRNRGFALPDFAAGLSSAVGPGFCGYPLERREDKIRQRVLLRSRTFAWDSRRPASRAS